MTTNKRGNAELARQVAVRVSDEVYNLLHDAVEKEGVTVRAIFENMVKEYVEARRTLNE